MSRRVFVIRIFPNLKSCLRLVRALSAEIQETWMEYPRYLNMDFLAECKKTNQIVNEGVA